MTVMHNKLLAEGYVETAPGILTSPDGKVVVEWWLSVASAERSWSRAARCVCIAAM
jgi:hypothetical protein